MKNKLSMEDKMTIILACIKGKEPISTLARRYDISETAIYRWKDQFLEGGRKGLIHNKKDNRVLHLEKELLERDRIIGELSVANKILKKTLS